LNFINYQVTAQDTVFKLLTKYNLTINQFVSANCLQHSELLLDPFRIEENWFLVIPLVGVGSDLEYNII
jgi:hypothetical protein